MQLSVSLNCPFVFLQIRPFRLWMGYIGDLSLLFCPDVVNVPKTTRLFSTRSSPLSTCCSRPTQGTCRLWGGNVTVFFCIYCTDFSQFNSIILILYLLHVLFLGRRFALSSMDMEQRDYDSRTALHVAAAEGNVNVRVDSSIECDIMFLLFVSCVWPHFLSALCGNHANVYNLWL